MKVRNFLCRITMCFGVVSLFAVIVMLLSSRFGFMNLEAASPVIDVLVAVVVYCFVISVILGSTLICVIDSILFVMLFYSVKYLEPQFSIPILFLIIAFALFNFKYSRRCNMGANIWCVGIINLAVMVILSPALKNADCVVLGYGIFCLILTILALRYTFLTSKCNKCTWRFKADIKQAEDGGYLLSYIGKDGNVHEYPLLEAPRYAVHDRVTVHVKPDNYDYFYIGSKSGFWYLVAEAVIVLVSYLLYSACYLVFI